MLLVRTHFMFHLLPLCETSIGMIASQSAPTIGIDGPLVFRKLLTLPNPLHADLLGSLFRRQV